MQNFLTNYRATHHSATDLAPGNFLVRHGYKKDFPRRGASEAQVEEARKKDISIKSERQNQLNKSNHRLPSQFKVGDKVYVKNNKRSSKFQPLFGPEEFEVVSKEHGGVTVKSNESDTQSRRHLDNIKLIPEPVTDVGDESEDDRPTDVVLTELSNALDDILIENSQSEVPEVVVRQKSSRQRHSNPKFDGFILD